MRCLVAIVGPTAVGKSRSGIQIAKQFNGEIINADSRQIYKLMDIGTAKPSLEDRNVVPHHIVDIIYPDQPYSVALYQHSAYEAIDSIQQRGKLPVMVGGSGQYIWSVIEGWTIPQVKPDRTYRESMEDRARLVGSTGLYSELEGIDPEAARKIQPNNLRRIIRALEIYHQTGVKPSELQIKKSLNYPVLIIGITVDRPELYSLIDTRADEMIAAGFVDEVKMLLSSGYSPELPAMSSIGYRQIIEHINDKVSLCEAVQKIKYETHRFARGQYAWFRLRDSRISWFNIDDAIGDKINYTIETFLTNVRQS